MERENGKGKGVVPAHKLLYIIIIHRSRCGYIFFLVFFGSASGSTRARYTLTFVSGDPSAPSGRCAGGVRGPGFGTCAGREGIYN